MVTPFELHPQINKLQPHDVSHEKEHHRKALLTGFTFAVHKAGFQVRKKTKIARDRTGLLRKGRKGQKLRRHYTGVFMKGIMVNRIEHEFRS